MTEIIDRVKGKQSKGGNMAYQDPNRLISQAETFDLLAARYQTEAQRLRLTAAKQLCPFEKGAIVYHRGHRRFYHVDGPAMLFEAPWYAVVATPVIPGVGSIRYSSQRVVDGAQLIPSKCEACKRFVACIHMPENCLYYAEYFKPTEGGTT